MNHIQLENISKIYNANSSQAQSALALLAEGMDSIAVKKRGDDITFLRLIIPGGADDSYGIEVAKLAGLPNSIISRAKEILKELELGSNAPTVIKEKKDDMQMSLISNDNAVVERLSEIDLNTLTPIEAINLLYELKGMI